MQRKLTAAPTRDRIVSGVLDASCILLLSMLLASTLGEWCASRTVTMLRIGQPETFWRGPLPLIVGILGNVLYALPVVAWITLLPEAIVGSGPGKQCRRLFIVASRSSGTSGAEGKVLVDLAGRFLAKSAPCLIWSVGLLLPHPAIAVLFVVTSTFALVGTLPLFRGDVTWYERLSATRVCRESRQDV